jgi:uncharacterized protein YkwD
MIVMSDFARLTTGALVALVWLAAFAAPIAASGCSLEHVSGSDVLVPDSARINQKLIDAAIRAEVNLLRCKEGLSALSGNSGLASVAATHASWMAKARNMSHQSQVPDQDTVMARLSSTGVRFRVGSENLGKVARYEIDGGSFRIRNESSCSFATNAGQPIGAHSYQTLAKHIVTLWYNSPSHRANMMAPNIRMVGSGAAYDPSAPYCGAYYLSQNYLG